MKNPISSLFRETKVLLRSIPSLMVALCVVTTISMNLLANKSINLPWDWLALDVGFTMSWAMFLTFDVVTKHFGPRAATLLSVVCILVNLLLCLMFFLGSLIPGTWGESYVDGSEAVINTALDRTFGGTWFIILGSSAAIFVSALVNNFTNWTIGRAFKKSPDGFGAYACRTYVSTFIGQFVDNMVFALIVSHTFFGWSMLQCVTCAITGAICELLCEVIFSPIGYKIVKNWARDNVGAEYRTLYPAKQ